MKRSPPSNSNEMPYLASFPSLTWTILPLPTEVAVFHRARSYPHSTLVDLVNSDDNIAYDYRTRIAQRPSPLSAPFFRRECSRPKSRPSPAEQGRQSLPHRHPKAARSLSVHLSRRPPMRHGP